MKTEIRSQAKSAKCWVWLLKGKRCCFAFSGCEYVCVFVRRAVIQFEKAEFTGLIQSWCSRTVLTHCSDAFHDIVWHRGVWLVVCMSVWLCMCNSSSASSLCFITVDEWQKRWWSRVPKSNENLQKYTGRVTDSGEVRMFSIRCWFASFSFTF